MTPNSRRIAAVAAEPGHRLRVTWRDGGEATVDLTGIVTRLPLFAPLQDERVFRAVAVVGHGTGVGWTDDLDYSADSLEFLANEQAEMAPADLRRWKVEMILSTAEMADLFGLSSSAVKAYLAGNSRIPVGIQIACAAMRREPDVLHARFRPRVAGRPRKPRPIPPSPEPTSHSEPT